VMTKEGREFGAVELVRECGMIFVPAWVLFLLLLEHCKELVGMRGRYSQGRAHQGASRSIDSERSFSKLVRVVRDSLTRAFQWNHAVVKNLLNDLSHSS
jgi:hypothetical protein